MVFDFSSALWIQFCNAWDVQKSFETNFVQKIIWRNGWKLPQETREGLPEVSRSYLLTYFWNSLRTIILMRHWNFYLLRYTLSCVFRCFDQLATFLSFLLNGPFTFLFYFAKVNCQLMKRYWNGAVPCLYSNLKSIDRTIWFQHDFSTI